jgi:O-antigen ligase
LHGSILAPRVAPAGVADKRSTGGLAASLFFVSLALACAGSRIGQVWPWACSALALLAAGWAAATNRAGMTRFAAAVYAFSAIAVLHTLLVSPAYTPAGLYHPLLLLLAFASFRCFDDVTERRAALVALAAGIVLAAWGLAQVALGVARAHALFETPATYAAVLNLLLLPLLALSLVRRRGPSLIALSLAFSAALFASASRGGLAALAAGLCMALLLAVRAGALERRRVIAPLGLLLAGWALAAGVRMLPAPDGVREVLPSVQAQAESSSSRLELYAASWRAWQERPLAGTGYLTFRNVLERDRARVPSYGEASETWFAHNDYLQTLQELGPLGLAALLALVLLPLVATYRWLPRLPASERPPAIAAAAGLAAMAAHALVDFPFYIPACLVLYGALLGALERRIANAGTAAWEPLPMKPWGRALRAGAAALAVILFLKPVLAEASAEWGLRRYAADQAQSAAFWLETARRLEPADWRYHWYAGQFWDGTASASGSRQAAQHAHDAFAAGVQANPLDVHNLLGMIALHRRLGRLLAQPADGATRADWVARAEALAPRNPVVRRERAILQEGK